MRVLIIDNYDSFTFNLFQLIGKVLHTDRLHFGTRPEVKVIRNDELSLHEIEGYSPTHIVISPGPGSPDDPAYFGICKDVILSLGINTPILGVCLGMQGIASVFGGKIVRDPIPMHGKMSRINHDGEGLFSGLPQRLEVMRYHSLLADASTLPDCLEITAVVEPEHMEDHTRPKVMGLRHRDFPIEGIQFHPESFATEGSEEIIHNFLDHEARVGGHVIPIEQSSGYKSTQPWEGGI
jgi:anthranilate synthase component 2